MKVRFKRTFLFLGFFFAEPNKEFVALALWNRIVGRRKGMKVEIWAEKKTHKENTISELEKDFEISNYIDGVDYVTILIK